MIPDVETSPEDKAREAERRAIAQAIGMDIADDQAVPRWKIAAYVADLRQKLQRIHEITGGAA